MFNSLTRGLSGLIILVAAMASPANAPLALAQDSSSTETPAPAVDDGAEAEAAAYAQWADSFLDSLTPLSGTIELKDGLATITVDPEKFYYLSPKDSNRVLTEAWGNPPDDTPNLGMIFPAGYSPLEAGAWGMTIEYEEDGYVSDKDAAKIDYDELLAEMKKDTESASQWRVSEGYPAISLVGWASPPYYDAENKKLHWAKEITFDGQETNTLNYNIQVLGRKGVLVMNFIANIDQVEAISESRDQVLAMTEFNVGNRYSDFDPSLDKVAAYGIGGLVAGKVLAKTGLLAAAFLFLKKFGIILVVAAGGFLARFFKRNKTDGE